MKAKIFLLWLPVVLCMATIFVLSSMPSTPIPPSLRGLDKPEHFLAYGILAVLAFIASRGTWPSLKIGALMMLSIAISVGYGMTDEYHQSFVPSRCCEFSDWLADLMGATTGAVLAAITARVKRMLGN